MTSVFSCLKRLAVAAERPTAARVRALPGAPSLPSAGGQGWARQVSSGSMAWHATRRSLAALCRRAQAQRKAAQ